MIQDYKSEGTGILDTPIAKLALTEDFKKKSAELGFITIRQMTDKGWGELLIMDGFCYTWFNELVRFLKSHDLLHYLESK